MHQGLRWQGAGGSVQTMARTDPEHRAMTVRLPASAWRKLHAFCVEQSTKLGKMVSLNVGVGILVDRLPDPGSSTPAAKKRDRSKPKRKPPEAA